MWILYKNKVSGYFVVLIRNPCVTLATKTLTLKYTYQSLQMLNKKEINVFDSYTYIKMC